MIIGVVLLIVVAGIVAFLFMGEAEAVAPPPTPPIPPEPTPTPVPIPEPAPPVIPVVPVTPAIVGFDLNKDGVIDEKDIEVFKRYYGKRVDSADPVSVACDFNNDGQINALDFSLLAEAVSKAKAYTCQQCGASFSSQAALDAHTSVAHPTPLPLPEPTPEPTPIPTPPPAISQRLRDLQKQLAATPETNYEEKFRLVELMFEEAIKLGLISSIAGGKTEAYIGGDWHMYYKDGRLIV